MTKKTYGEQIADLEAARAANVAAMEAITNKCAEESRTKDEAERDSFAELREDVKAIDAELVDLRDMEKLSASKAVPVDGKSSKGADASRAGIRVEVRANVPKGTGFTRFAMALAASRGNRLEAVEYAKRWHDSTPEVETVLRAAVTAGTTTDADWAAPLVEYQNLASEFIELLRPQTIIGRIDGIRRVPFNVKIPTQTQGGTVGWVGEGAPKPVGELKFGQTSLGMAKAAGIIVLTEELVRSSSPSAEAIVRQDLTAAIAQFLDAQFVDPAVAEVANVSPASITNGVTPVVATGTDADSLKADVRTLFANFIAANMTPAGGVWIMTPTMALTLGMMQNALGQPEFPGIDMNGGTFMGLPVIVSNNIAPEPGEAGPPVIPAGERIILVKASEILLADDGGVTLDVSREASLQMNDSPTAGATSLVSLWQNNLVGLRAERYVNWKRRRLEAVGYITGAAYAA